jgi:hypothetical protein
MEIWVYTDDKGNYLTISKTNELKYGRTKNINKSAIWFNKRKALTWKSSIEIKYPNMRLAECGLILK